MNFSLSRLNHVVLLAAISAVTSGGAMGQTPAEQLSATVEDIQLLSGPQTLGEFLAYTRDRFKIKIEINSAALKDVAPDLDVREIQIKSNIPAGMMLGTILQASLDQLPVPSTYSIKGDRVIIGPGSPPPLKDMSQTSPLRSKFTAKLKLSDLGVKEKAVRFRHLVDWLSEKVKAPIYIDSAAIRTVGPADFDAPDISELEINVTKLKDGNALQILQHAISQRQEDFPGVHLIMQTDHLRVTATRKKKAPEALAPDKDFANVKVGDWIVMKTTQRVNGRDFVSHFKRTVTATDETDVTLNQEVIVNGKKVSAMELKLPWDVVDPLSIIPKEAKGKNEMAKTGNQTLIIKGKKVESEWTHYTYSMTSGGKTVQSVKVWVAKDIPLGKAKMEGDNFGQKTSMEITDFGRVK